MGKKQKKIHHNVLHTKTFRIELKTFEVFLLEEKKNPNLKKNKETLTTTTSGNGSYNRRKYKKLMIQQLFVTQKISLQINVFRRCFVKYMPAKRARTRVDMIINKTLV